MMRWLLLAVGLASCVAWIARRIARACDRWETRHFEWEWGQYW